ncbi:kinase-like protein [Microthyrium microscopicum]|uniref:Kinase-like protein n=1 Tax=Microthyrium microscopicum TaxID=703497 RepID=A0A6A6UC53_9PEZI|nr:kinase-like protein [Microthyrium microscopicum]
MSASNSHEDHISALRNNPDFKPSTVRHISAPEYQSPSRHHEKRSTNPRKPVKTTLNAQSKYSNSEDDGPAEHRINQYLIQQEIGRGSFGSVHLAVDQFGREYAVKEFSKSRLRKRAQSNLLRQSKFGYRRSRYRKQHGGTDGNFNEPMHRQSMSPEPGAASSLDLIKEEIAIMKKLDHPNVVSLIEVLDDPHEDSLYMVLEMCKKGVVMKVGLGEPAQPYSLEQCRHWLRDMILGLEYLHAQGIIHRDIKPDNCLVTQDDVVKIVDFGVSEMFSKDSEMTTTKSAGSPAFMPPELCVAKHGEVSGRAVDIWSMGVTLYCLVFGHIPFEKTGMLDLFESIKDDAVNVPGDIDPQLKHLFLRLLEKNPAKRIDMDGIRAHPWVTKDGTDELLPKEENIMNIIEPPTDQEVAAAITEPLRRMITVMKAASKFKRLLHKTPSLVQGIFGNKIVQPPRQLEKRTHSDSLSNRHPVEGPLATKGIHRDIDIKEEMTLKHEYEPINEDVDMSDTDAIESPESKETLPPEHQHQQQKQKQTLPPPQERPSLSANSSDDPTGAISPRSETGKGQAHDPLEDQLFLLIGPHCDAPPPDPGLGPIVSESPGAADMNVYEKAYEEEIQRILAEKQHHRPTLFLTKRVENTKHLREHKDITDFSRPAGLAKLVEAGMGKGEGEKKKLVDVAKAMGRERVEQAEAEDAAEEDEEGQASSQAAGVE